MQVLTGVNDDIPRWKVCLQITEAGFGMAVGRLFTQRHFNEGAKAIVSIYSRVTCDIFYF